MPRRKKFDPTKPHKSRWIYGMSHTKIAKGGRVQFPPVVPTITTELKEEIVSFLAAATIKRANDDAESIRQNQQQIAELERIVSPTMIEKRQIFKLKKEQQELEESIRATYNRLERQAEKDVSNFSLLRGVRQVAIDDHIFRNSSVSQKALLLITCPIVINAVQLGTYDVWYTPEIKAANKAFDLQRRDRIAPRGPHPHFNVNPCYGNYGPVMQELHTNCQFRLLIGMYLQYLGVYNGSSPLLPLSYFKRGGYANKQPLA